jgi:hypothetical protein
MKDDGEDEGKGRMLKPSEIKEICERNQLSRMEVYEIRSEFASMCLMSKEDEAKER